LPPLRPRTIPAVRINPEYRRSFSVSVVFPASGWLMMANVRRLAVAAAKALADLARTNPLLVIRGGMLGTSLMTADDVKALASLPSREELLARIAGAFQAPLVKTAGLLQALPRNFAYGLSALIEKQTAEAA